jgi:single-strand DNA-binding protein
MATNTNYVTVVGNVTRDPELRFTPSGQATATFGLAVNRSWQNRQTQEWEESTSFFDIVCWAQQAENVSETLRKGTRILVTGRLEQRSWETSEGEKRHRVEIIADELGPSLRFATAAVTKNPPKNADGGSSGGGGGYSGGSSSSSSGGGGGGGGGYSGGGGGNRPPERQAPSDSGYDEEPF